MKKLLHGKETLSKTKRELTDWEDIFANYAADNILSSSIYKELQKLNNNETVQLELVKEREQGFFFSKGWNSHG